MEDIPQTSQCQNWIISTNILPLHESYCFRNIKKCVKCDEMIDKTEMDDHLKIHDDINCSHCHNKIKSDLYEKHLSNCGKKVKKCEYCKLDFDSNEWAKHAYQCGSRTERCEICDKYIILRELELHQRFCFENISKGFHSNNNNHINNNIVEINSDLEEEIHKNKKNNRKKKISNDFDDFIDDNENNVIQNDKKNHFNKYPTRQAKNSDSNINGELNNDSIYKKKVLKKKI